PAAPDLRLSPGSPVAPSHVSAWDVSADARFVALGASDVVHLFDARTGAKLHDFAGRALVIGVRFSDGGDKLSAVWRDGEAVIWDVASGDVTAQFHLLEDDDLTSVQGLGMAPDTRSLFILGHPAGRAIPRPPETPQRPG